MQTEDDDVKLFKTSEVAELCAVTEETIRRWIKEGELPAIRMPGGSTGRLRVRKPDLLKFLNERYGAL